MAVLYMSSCAYIPVSGDPIQYNGNGSCTRVAGRTGWAYGTSYTGSSGTQEMQVFTPGATVSGSAAFSSYSIAATRNFGVSISSTCTAYFPVNGAPSGTTGVAGISPWVVNDPTPVPAGWVWVCLQWNLNSGTAGFIKVYINGTLRMSISPDLSGASSFNGGFLVRLGNRSGGDSTATFAGDFIVSNDNTWLIPDSRVDCLAPSADVQNDWTPSTGTSRFPLLADNGGPAVNMGDWVSSDVIGARQVVSLSGMSHTPSQIHAVQVSGVSGKDDTGPRTMSLLLNNSETVELDSGSQDFRFKVHETNPVGGSAWTKSAVDSATAGAVVKS